MMKKVVFDSFISIKIQLHHIFDVTALFFYLLKHVPSYNFFLQPAHSSHREADVRNRRQCDFENAVSVKTTSGGLKGHLMQL
uniref:Ovule protein n=1 Tax=Bursaphelenchus xylophilus TaxID=6326 RepID=A0A1I7SE33_BURXY